MHDFRTMETKRQHAWSPLRHPAFRALCLSGGVYFVGNAMQSMAAAWQMVEVSGSSFLASLVQTAVFLPMFLLGLPAGVLADTTDRRTLISGALLAQAGACAVLTLLALLGWAAPAVVLGAMFVFGCCAALLTPAWNSAVLDPLPREEWPQAITAISISYNVARAVGPVLAGVLFAWVGSGGVFAVTVATTLAMWWSIRRWPPRPHPPSRLPAERLWGGMVSGLRYALHAPHVFAQLVRATAFGAVGSALWALLPMIAQSRLDEGARGYGWLMGALGAGAIGMGLMLGRLRARHSLDRIIGVSCLVFSAAMIAGALSRSAPVLLVAMVFGGAAWMTATSTFNSVTQSSVPPWVRSRALALHIVSFLGAFAFGSAFWGMAGDLAGLGPALLLAAALMAANALLSRPLPLRVGDVEEITQAAPWDELFVTFEPDPEAGPVSVEIAYRIRPGVDREFLDTIGRIRASRRRDGATLWRVYKDLAEPDRYVERFIVESWSTYLHQRARATVADQALEAEIRSFLAEGESARMAHYVAER